MREFARRLGYAVTVIPLYSDMVARDLLQRRTVDEAGSSGWAAGPLIEAALEGRVAVLDGIERLSGDTLAVLSRLAHDRDIDLPDGSRLLHHLRYDALAGGSSHTITPDGRAVYRVHPSFRIVAIGSTSAAAAWEAAAPRSGPPLPARSATALGELDAPSFGHPEVCGMFDAHVLPVHSVSEMAGILGARCPEVPRSVLLQLASVADALWTSALSEFADDAATSQSLRLSLRQLLRAAQHLRHSGTDAEHTGPPLARQLRELVLYASLPARGRAAFDAVLAKHGLASADKSRVVTAALPRMTKAADAAVASPGAPFVVFRSEDGGRDVRLATGAASDPALVPHTLFFDIPQHRRLLQRLAADIDAGARFLLLLGNQGTGKNRVVDHLLQSLRWEREYMQLHRDSTVASLTLAPTLRGGVVRWEDSALVRAARHGRVLVIDELDKAPGEVTAVLKSLVDDGDMLLGDGRRIVAGHAAASAGDSAMEIRCHPRFMIIALANRPGW